MIELLHGAILGQHACLFKIHHSFPGLGPPIAYSQAQIAFIPLQHLHPMHLFRITGGRGHHGQLFNQQLAVIIGAAADFLQAIDTLLAQISHFNPGDVMMLKFQNQPE